MGENRKEEFLQFVRFLSANPRIWYQMVCDDNLDTESACELIKILVQHEFYVLIPVIIGRTKSLGIDELIYRMFLEMLYECWKDNPIEAIREDILSLLNLVKKKTTEVQKDGKTHGVIG